MRKHQIASREQRMGFLERISIYERSEANMRRIRVRNSCQLQNTLHSSMLARPSFEYEMKSWFVFDIANVNTASGLRTIICCYIPNYLHKEAWVSAVKWFWLILKLKLCAVEWRFLMISLKSYLISIKKKHPWFVYLLATTFFPK